MLAESGKTAPSFIITLGVLALLGVGYVVWDVYSPNPVARSEMIVREFNRSVASELGPLRGALREQAARYKENPESVDEIRETIDDLAADARFNVDELADAAREEIEMLDGVGLRTQENRLRRVKQLKGDAHTRIDRLADEARARLPQKAP